MKRKIMSCIDGSCTGTKRRRRRRRRRRSSYNDVIFPDFFRRQGFRSGQRYVYSPTFSAAAYATIYIVGWINFGVGYVRGEIAKIDDPVISRTRRIIYFHQLGFRVHAIMGMIIGGGGDGGIWLRVVT